MAKRKKYTTMKSKKIEPSVQTISLSTPTVAAGTSENFYVDISQCVSLLNRRFYRQGINWAVSSIKILSPQVFQGAVTVGKLPNTWVMSNAWEKGFRAWQHMIKNSTDDQGLESIKGKFLDFKIYSDAAHHAAGYNANLLPIDNDGAAYTRGQWQPAEIEVPSTSGASSSTAWELIAVGPSNPGVGASGLNAKSLIAGYAVSRALPDVVDPNVPDDASNVGENWIMSLFTDGTEQDSDVIAMLEVTGDKAPYPYENDGTSTDTMYPGGQNQAPALERHDSEYITGTTIGGTTRLRGGNFPCGLMKINLANAGSTSNVIIQIDLVPGTHRGYLCEPMTEM